VVDAGFMPSAAAVNPALTIAGPLPPRLYACDLRSQHEIGVG
jgi:hypothetical protein